MDDLPVGLLLAALVFLIFLSAFFSASETATMALNRYRLEDQANKKHRRAKILKRLLEKPDRLLGTILLGNNLVNNAAVAITTILAWRFYGEAGVAVGTAMITIVILVFAEIPPKTIASTRPEPIAYFAAHILNVLQRAFAPLILLVSYAARISELLPGHDRREESDSLEADELRVAVLASQHRVDQIQRNALLNVLDLNKSTVESAMTPRTNVEAINLDDDVKAIKRQILQTEHSRLPIYRETLNDIQGELEVREFLQNHAHDLADVSIETIIGAAKEPFYLPEDATLLDQIENLHNAPTKMGIVVDEYGEFSGIVTQSQMFAEIAGVVSGQFTGKITQDESDEGYVIDAEIGIRALNRHQGWNLPTEGANTLNGLILEHLGDIPQKDSRIELDQYRIEVVEVAGSAVTKAKVWPLPSELESDRPDAQSAQ